MKKNLSQKLRDSEEIYTCEPATVWINRKARECYLTVIKSKYSPSELA